MADLFFSKCRYLFKQTLILGKIILYVLEVEYNDDEEILRLAVDFRQFDESEDMSGPSTFGSLRINSSIAVNKAGVVQNPVSAIETNNYPEFFFTNNELNIPILKAGDNYFTATLKLQQDSNGENFLTIKSLEKLPAGQ